MIIYLEGADGTGKSTLADYIHGTLDEVYYPWAMIEPREAYDTMPNSKTRLHKGQLLTILKRWAKDNTAHILDRGPLSDIVYRLFDDEKPVITIDEWLDFVKEYGHRIFTVHCKAPSAENNMNKRGDDNKVSLKYHPIITRVYSMLFDMIKLRTPNVIEYNYDKKSSINEVLGKISYFVYMANRSKL